MAPVVVGLAQLRAGDASVLVFSCPPFFNLLGCGWLFQPKEAPSARFAEGEAPDEREDGAVFLVEVQAGDSPWMDFFLPCYASYKHKPIPKPPRSTHSNKSAGLSHLVLIRVPGWEECWLSQMRTFASRLTGVSLSLAVLCLHPHMRCTSAGFASLLAAAPLAT